MKPDLIGQLFARLYRHRFVASIALLFLLDIATYLAFSKPGGPHVVQNQDKFMHAFGFFGLFLVGHVSLNFDMFPRVRARRIILSLNSLLWLVYGGFIELVQKYLSYRSSSLGDLLADGAGIVAGALFVSLIHLYPRSSQDGKT